MEQLICSPDFFHKLYNWEVPAVRKLRKGFDTALKEAIKQNQATELKIKIWMEEREKNCLEFTKILSDVQSPQPVRPDLNSHVRKISVVEPVGQNRDNGELQSGSGVRAEKSFTAPTSSDGFRRHTRGSLGNKRKTIEAPEEPMAKKLRTGIGNSSSDPPDSSTESTGTFEPESQMIRSSESLNNSSGPAAVERLGLFGNNTLDNSTSPEAIHEGNVASSTVLRPTLRSRIPVPNDREEGSNAEGDFADEWMQELNSTMRELPPALQSRLIGALEKGDYKLKNWDPKGSDKKVNEICKKNKQLLRDNFIKVVSEKRHVTTSNIDSVIIEIANQTFKKYPDKVTLKIKAFLQRSLLRQVLLLVAEVHADEGCNAACP